MFTDVGCNENILSCNRKSVSSFFCIHQIWTILKYVIRLKYVTDCLSLLAIKRYFFLWFWKQTGQCQSPRQQPCSGGTGEGLSRASRHAQWLACPPPVLAFSGIPARPNSLSWKLKDGHRTSSLLMDSKDLLILLALCSLRQHIF